MKVHMIHRIGSEVRTLLTFCIENCNSEMVQHLQFLLDLILKSDLRTHIICLNLELDYRRSALKAD